MKIVLFSRVPRWYSFKNERLASRLAADGHEILGVIVEETPTLRSLREWTKKLGWKVFAAKLKQRIIKPQQANNPASAARRTKEFSPRVFFVKSHNSPESVEILHNLEPDLIVLRGCGIIKKQVLETPKIGVINPHYAMLPDFRGMDVTEWSALVGAPIAVSVHTVNEGVDMGVVLKSQEIQPEKTDTVGSLRDKSAALAVELLAETVNDFEKGKTFPQIETDESQGKQYFQMHQRLKDLANRRLSKFN